MVKMLTPFPDFIPSQDGQQCYCYIKRYPHQYVLEPIYEPAYSNIDGVEKRGKVFL